MTDTAPDEYRQEFDGATILPDHRRHISMLIDLAENPDGIDVTEWAASFPPALVHTMLGVVMAASQVAEAYNAWLHSSSEAVETETRLATIEACQVAADAVAEFWRELAEPEPIGFAMREGSQVPSPGPETDAGPFTAEEPELTPEVRCWRVGFHAPHRWPDRRGGRDIVRFCWCPGLTE